MFGDLSGQLLYCDTEHTEKPFLHQHIAAVSTVKKAHKVSPISARAIEQPKQTTVRCYIKRSRFACCLAGGTNAQKAHMAKTHTLTDHNVWRVVGLDI